MRGFSALPTIIADIESCQGSSSHLDAYVKNIKESIHQISTMDISEQQIHARNIADRLAVAIQASILIRFGDEIVANAYIASRIMNSTNRGINAGGTHIYTMEECEHILARNMPVVERSFF